MQWGRQYQACRTRYERPWSPFGSDLVSPRNYRSGWAGAGQHRIQQSNNDDAKCVKTTSWASAPMPGSARQHVAKSTDDAGARNEQTPHRSGGRCHADGARELFAHAKSPRFCARKKFELRAPHFWSARSSRLLPPPNVAKNGPNFLRAHPPTPPQACAASWPRRRTFCARARRKFRSARSSQNETHHQGGGMVK